jgi:hypothetical protein
MSAIGGKAVPNAIAGLQFEIDQFDKAADEMILSVAALGFRTH